MGQSSCFGWHSFHKWSILWDRPTRRRPIGCDPRPGISGECAKGQNVTSPKEHDAERAQRVEQLAERESRGEPLLPAGENFQWHDTQHVFED